MTSHVAVRVALGAASLLSVGCRPAAPAETTPDSTPEVAPAESSLAVRVRWLGGHAAGLKPRVGVPGCEVERASLLRRVGAERGLADVLVSVPGVPGQAPASAELVARGCRFEPAALLLAPGGDLLVRNEDQLLHAFELRRVDGGAEVPVQTLAVPPGTPELRFAVQVPGRYRIASSHLDDVHGWLYVVEGAAALTDGEGRAELALPPAEHAVEVVHPAVGIEQHGVAVPSDGPASLYLDWGSSP